MKTLKPKQIRYQLSKILGQGAMSTVYLGKDTKSELNVAIKKLTLNSDFSESESILRFKREADVISKFSHPNIIKLHNLVEKDNNIYLVMEYFPGEDLKKSQNKFSLLEKIEIIEKIASTLSYIHEKDIIHRDLKPENILVKKNGEIDLKIIDFGLAYLTDINDVFKGSIVGSFAYISPEQTGLLRRTIDNRSDLYSLGATFYELVTGKLPFSDQDIGKLIHKHLAAIPPIPSSINSEIPQVIDHIIMKLLNKEPEDRYQTASGLKEDLTEYLNSPDKKSFQIGLKDKTAKLNYQIKIVGRDKELETINNLYHQSINGNTQKVFLHGDAGSGKSKLIASFREEIIKEKINYLSFKCERSMINVPYASFNDIFRNLFDNFLSDNVLIKKIESQMGENINLIFSLFPLIKNYFTHLKNKDSIKSGDISEKQTTKEKALDAFIQFLKIIGNLVTPIIFFIDDIQWADNDSLELIGYINSKLSDSKLFFIASSRELINFVPDTKTNESVTHINIKPLDKTDIKDFITKMLNATQEFSDLFYHKIHENTLGNPFFVLEMIKSLFDSQILFNQNFIWKIDEEKLSQFKFEKDVSKLLLKKLSDFTKDELRILSIASVIGKNFNLNLLNKLLSYDLSKDRTKNISNTLDRVISATDKARSKQLIREEVFKGKGVYAFIHDKVIEILHNNLKLKESKDLHLVCAKTLEKMFKKNINENIYILAYHYNQTDEAEKKSYYNEKAFKKALSQYSLNESAYYLQKIVDYKLEINKFNKDDITLIIQLGQILQVIGKIKEGLDYLTHALAKASEFKQDNDQVTIYLLLGRGYYYLNDNPLALKHYNLALTLAEEIGQEIKVYYPYQLIGSSYFFGSDMRNAEYNFSKAVEYINKNDWEQKLPLLGIRTWTYVFLGQLDKVKQELRYIEDNLHRITNPLSLTQVYHYCAVSYSMAGIDTEKALAYSLKCYEYAKNANYILFQYSSYASRMWAHFYQGNYIESENAINTGLSMSKQNNIFIGIYLFHSYFVEINLLKKDFGKANELATKFLADQSQKDKIADLIFLKAQAAYHYYYNDFDSCIKKLDEALKVFDESDIAIEGIKILYFKKHILEKIGQNTSDIMKKLKILSKRKGIDTFTERAHNFIKMLDEAKKEKSTRVTSYAGSASVIKERLQLGNIVRTSQIISSILDTDELLAMIMQKTVEVTGAERGALLLYDHTHEKLEYKVIHNIEGENQEFKVSKNILDKVIQSKRGLVLTSIKDGDADISRSIIAQKIKSIICAPLLSKDKLIGLLYLDSKLLNNLFLEEDLELLTVFTSQAAISIENARLHEQMLEKARIEQEMEIAKDIQTSILPFVKDTDAYEFSAYMRPATEVGGDYYDLFIQEPPYFGVFGDVSGHGLKSGLVMMMAEVAFNTIMTDKDMRKKDLSDLYQKINITLFENIQNRLTERSNIGYQYSSMYMTFRMFRFDDKGNFEMFGNDHAEPFICRAKTGEIERIESSGFLIGIMENATLNNKSYKFKLNPGDMLIFHSDGISEAHNEAKKRLQKNEDARAMYGEEKIYEQCKKYRKKSSKEIIRLVIEDLDNWMHEQEDDITMMIIKKK